MFNPNVLVHELVSICEHHMNSALAFSSKMQQQGPTRLGGQSAAIELPIRLRSAPLSVPTLTAAPLFLLLLLTSRQSSLSLLLVRYSSHSIYH